MNKLLGIANYDILSDPEYQDLFAYMPSHHPKRDQYAISQFKDRQMKKFTFDIVRLAVDLPYMSTEKAKELEFNPEYMYGALRDLKNQKENAEMQKSFGNLLPTRTTKETE